MIYPQKLNSHKGELILKIAILISILVAIILTVINRLTTPNLPWAALANGGIIYIWITVYYSIRKNINIGGHVLLQTIAICLLTVFIDYELGFKGWSIDIAIPIIILVANVTMLILTIITHKRFLKYVIYQLLIVIISMIPIVLVSENIVKNEVLSIIASGISILNLIFSLILSARDWKEAIVRKFHM